MSEKEVKILEQTFQQFWMYQGGTTVPNPFIRYYQQLQLTAQECLMLSWWLQHSNSEYFPLNVDEVCEVFSISEHTLFQIIQHLLDRQVVSVTQKENEQGKKEEYYSLAPLFQQLEILHRQEVEKKEESDNPNLIFVIEKEFGRPISSYEIQMIKSWIDKDEYSYELILAALKEAVLNQVFTLKYMDKILLTWQRKGFKTVQQVIQDKNRTRNGNFAAKPKETTPIPLVPLDNWLD